MEANFVISPVKRTHWQSAKFHLIFSQWSQQLRERISDIGAHSDG